MATGGAGGGVDADFFAVGAEAGVGVAAPFAGVFPGGIEVAEWDDVGGFDIEEVGILIAVLIGVGVVEDPFVAGEESAVAVLGHGVLADDDDFFGIMVFKEIETFAVGRLVGEGEDMCGIAPDEM